MSYAASIISPPRRGHAEDGFMLIETVLALVILVIGVIGVLGAFDSARREASYSERRNTAAATAEQELLRITALPWTKIALNSASSWTSNSSSATDPTSYLSAGPCVTSANLPQHEPCYQYDWTNSSNVEPLVTAASGYDTEPDPYTFKTLAPNGSTRLEGSVYRYITWVNDSQCVGTGNTCGGSNDYKRITVAVSIIGVTTPIVLTSLYANPVGGTQNPLFAGATCIDSGASVPCTH
jgi:Tfp pilus assembly protein PilV